MDLFIEHGRYREPHPGRVGADDAPYSVAQEEYRAERAFDRRRTRVRKLRAALRTLILLIFVPVLLIAVFTASYAMTFILSGAEPEEVLDALVNCFKMVWEHIRSACASWGVWPLE